MDYQHASGIENMLMLKIEEELNEGKEIKIVFKFMQMDEFAQEATDRDIMQKDDYKEFARLKNDEGKSGVGIVASMEGNPVYLSVLMRRIFMTEPSTLEFFKSCIEAMEKSTDLSSEDVIESFKEVLSDEEQDCQAFIDLVEFTNVRMADPSKSTDFIHQLPFLRKLGLMQILVQVRQRQHEHTESISNLFKGLF